MPDFSSSPSFSLYLYVYAECLLNEEEYAWGRRRVHRRRNYAVVILTVDTTLNMYVRRAGNAGIRDCPETGAAAHVCLMPL